MLDLASKSITLASVVITNTRNAPTNHNDYIEIHWQMSNVSECLAVLCEAGGGGVVEFRNQECVHVNNAWVEMGVGCWRV